MSAGWPAIKKQPRDAAAANLADYERVIAAFSWNDARALLDGLPGGGLNIAYEAVDRHAAGPLAETVALRFLSKRADTVSTGQFDTRSARAPA